MSPYTLTPSPVSRLFLIAQGLPGIGVGSLRKLARSLRTLPNPPVESAREVLRDIGFWKGNPTDITEAESDVARLLERCAAASIWIMSALDEKYPPLLRSIADFPPILYGRGSIQAVSHIPAVAVVGTREASELGRVWAHKIAKLLAENQVSTVSGLALGIDTAAHHGALEGHGITVAVMAHGLDTIAPASNRDLAASILESGGVLISEHPPGVPPRPPEFVRRNRIQSGMSVASIVVESGEIGGAIHQAKFTYDQGRLLYAALPPEELRRQYDFKASGAGVLMARFGAKAIESQGQLLEQLPIIRNALESALSRVPSQASWLNERDSSNPRS